MLLAQDAGKTVADQEDLQSRFSSFYPDENHARRQQADEQDPGQHHGPAGRPGQACRGHHGWNWSEHLVYILFLSVCGP